MGAEVIKDIADKIRSFDFMAQAQSIAQDNGSRIAELQREQLADGLDINGNIETGPYSAQYAKLKKRRYTGLGAMTDHITFYATGQLYGDLRVVFGSGTFEVRSDLDTFDYMKMRINNGATIGVPDLKYGLCKEKRMQFAKEIMIPSLREYFKELIKL